MLVEAGYAATPFEKLKRGKALIERLKIIVMKKWLSDKGCREWDAIVLGGLRRDQSIASFIDVISQEDSQKIRDYVIYEALKTQEQGYWGGLLKIAVESICVPPWVLDLM